jgi:hypothetical protein
MAISKQLDDLLWLVVVFNRMGHAASCSGDRAGGYELVTRSVVLHEQAEKLGSPELVSEELARRYRLLYVASCDQG